MEDLRLFRGAVLFRFRGDGLFEGEFGSLGGTFSSGSNICDGSIPSPVLTLRALADLFGVALVVPVVCLLVDFRGLRLGAGVNSSSFSSLIKLSSSSESSTTIVLRVARRVGRVGDSADMLPHCSGFRCWSIWMRLNSIVGRDKSNVLIDGKRMARQEYMSLDSSP